MAQNIDDPQNEEDILGNLDEELLDASLRIALHRQDCPGTMELAEYQLGLLAASEASRLTTHLDRCPYCQAETTRLAEFLSEDAPVLASALEDEDPPWRQGRGFKWRHLKETGRMIIQVVKEALTTSVHKLERGLQPPTGQLAFGELKSAEARQPLFELALTEGIEDFEVNITAKPKKDDPNHCTVTVKVNIPSRGGWPHLAGTEVILKQNDTIWATQATDVFGEAVFKEVATDKLAQLTFDIKPHERES